MERKEKEERPRCLCHSDWRQRQEMRRQTFWPHPSDEKSPRGNFPQLCAEKVHARALGSICIGVVQSMERCRQAPLLLGAPTHSHTEQRSPRADKSSGRTRNESGDGCTWEKEGGKEGECHAENAKYLFSSRVPLLSSSDAARVSARALEGCGRSAIERDLHDRQTERRRERAEAAPAQLELSSQTLLPKL